MTIHEVREKDLAVLSNLFVTTQFHNRPEEDWTYSTALPYLEYYYHNQPDLFLAVYSEDIPVGAIMSILKPSFDGIHLTQLELFVAEEIKEQDSNEVKKQLLSNHLELADAKYHPSQIEIISCKRNLEDIKNMMNVEVNSSLIILYANLKNVIKQLSNSL